MQAESQNHAQNKSSLSLFYTIQQILYFQLSKEFTAFQRVYSYMKQKNATDDKRRIKSKQQSPRSFIWYSECHHIHCSNNQL